MSCVARRCFFGVHAPDSPACVHVDTETNTSFFNFRLRIFGDFSISAGKFSISVAKNIGPDPAMYLHSLSAPFGICKNNIFSG